VELASAAVFLAVNLTMEGAGWVVGTPRSAERATMLTAMIGGILALVCSGEVCPAVPSGGVP
jgi:hypothetical protein